MMNALAHLPNSGNYLVLLRGRLRLRIADIVRLEADRNYTRFVLADGRTLLMARTLGSFEKELPAVFFRANKSVLVNRLHIKVFAKDWLEMIDGFGVVVARRRKI